MRYGMVIDLKRCIGCYACEIACKAEHGTGPGVMYARVQKQEVGKYPNARRISLPLLCMHCADAACVQVCPTGATTKRPDGIVAIDAEQCVGCRYCMMVCPYCARYYHDGATNEYFPGLGLTPYEEQAARGHPPCVVEKCDFCLHRLDRGLDPACVANCPAKARIFGDLDDPSSEVSRLVRDRAGFQLHPELGTDPSVFYLPP